MQFLNVLGAIDFNRLTDLCRLRFDQVIRIFRLLLQCLLKLLHTRHRSHRCQTLIFRQAGIDLVDLLVDQVVSFLQLGLRISHGIFDNGLHPAKAGVQPIQFSGELIQLCNQRIHACQDLIDGGINIAQDIIRRARCLTVCFSGHDRYGTDLADRAQGRNFFKLFAIRQIRIELVDLVIQLLNQTILLRYFRIQGINAVIQRIESLIQLRQLILYLFGNFIVSGGFSIGTCINQFLDLIVYLNDTVGIFSQHLDVLIAADDSGKQICAVLYQPLQRSAHGVFAQRQFTVHYTVFQRSSRVSRRFTGNGDGRIYSIKIIFISCRNGQLIAAVSHFPQQIQCRFAVNGFHHQHAQQAADVGVRQCQQSSIIPCQVIRSIQQSSMLLRPHQFICNINIVCFICSREHAGIDAAILGQHLCLLYFLIDRHSKTDGAPKISVLVFVCFCCNFLVCALHAHKTAAVFLHRCMIDECFVLQHTSLKKCFLLVGEILIVFHDQVTQRHRRLCFFRMGMYDRHHGKYHRKHQQHRNSASEELSATLHVFSTSLSLFFRDFLVPFRNAIQNDLPILNDMFSHIL